MLDMGFLPDIRRIVELLVNRRQTLLFSATFSAEIRGLAKSLLNDPVSVDIEPQTTSADTVDQVVYLVDTARKRDLLAELVRKRNLTQVLVFTRTKLQAGRLASQLDRDGVEAISIHGDRSQPERERALSDFKSGAVRVLVATDVAARGLDIDALPVVVNYELPHTAHDYVHRIGRTGRAGAAGQAISLVAPEEEDYLRAINRLLKRDLPVRVVKGFEPTFGSTEPHSARPRRSRTPSSAPRSRSATQRSAASGRRTPAHHSSSRLEAAPEAAAAAPRGDDTAQLA